MQEPRAGTAQIEKIKSIFEHACDLGVGERIAYVREASAGDPTLETELHSLLHAHDASLNFFERLSEELIGPVLSALELSEAESSKETDRQILHYEILEKIGMGGMGVVYKARDTRLARIVALKFLPRRDESNPAAQARLLAEARAASALDHPNIGVVYDISEAANGRQFMAMAWYDGETLRETLRRGPVSVDYAVTIGTQLASALAAAHDAGIIHRDVKPANVIITRSGTAKLLDFGIAKLMHAEEGETLVAAGTVAYMSPEKTRRETPSARSDIWSVGVLLYEILAGQRPFQGESEDEIVRAIRTEEPAPLQLLRPEIPQTLADLVQRCLQKSADERYGSANELLLALNECQRSLSTSGPSEPSEPSSHPPRKASPRNKWWVVATAGALLVAVVAIFSTYGRRTEINHSSGSAVSVPPVSMTVLPFTTAGPPDSGSYLERALAEELRNELARYRNIVVPGYLSSSSLGDLNSALPRLESDPRSRYAIAGVIQPSPRNSLHLQLVDAKTRRAMWSEDYPLAQAQLSTVVPKARSRILSALNIATSDQETARAANQTRPNPAAYELYLRGRNVELNALPRNVLEEPTPESIRRAQALYAEARALDPSFALARARLAMSHIKSAMIYDTTRTRLEQARLEAETALRLDSGIVDAHETLAEYSNKTGNLAGAITDLERSLRRAPHNVNLIVSLGSMYRFAGRFEDAIGQFHLAQTLDPRNPFPFWYAATTYGPMRRQDLGSREFSRLIAISPDDYEVRLIMGHSYLRRTGNADTLAAQAAAIPPSWDNRGMATYGRYTALMVKREYREGLQMLARARYELSTDGYVYSPTALMRGDMLTGLGDRVAASKEYTKAVSLLVDSVAKHPNDAAIRASLGLAYAELGNRQQALRESEKAMSLAPLATDASLATAVMGIAVQSFGRVGEKDRAFQMIELMLSMPAGREITVPFLRVWPGFDPLRSDPRFTQLLERFAVRSPG